MGRNEWIRTLNRAALSVKDSLHIQFSPSTDWVFGCGAGGGGGGLRDDLAEILFQTFLREALVNKSGMGRNAGMSRLWWCVTCTNHASLLTVVRRDSCGSVSSRLSSLPYGAWGSSRNKAYILFSLD